MSKAKSPTDTLYIGNLDDRVTEALLREVFSQAGNIRKLNVVQVEKQSNYGFCQYSTVESAIYAWGLFRDVVTLYGKGLRVDFSNPKTGGDELDEAVQAFWQKVQSVCNLTNAKILQMASQNRDHYARPHGGQQVASTAQIQYNNHQAPATQQPWMASHYSTPSYGSGRNPANVQDGFTAYRPW